MPFTEAQRDDLHYYLQMEFGRPSAYPLAQDQQRELAYIRRILFSGVVFDEGMRLNIRETLRMVFESGYPGPPISGPICTYSAEGSRFKIVSASVSQCCEAMTWKHTT